MKWGDRSGTLTTARQLTPYKGAEGSAMSFGAFEMTKAGVGCEFV